MLNLYFLATLIYYFNCKCIVSCIPQKHFFFFHKINKHKHVDNMVYTVVVLLLVEKVLVMVCCTSAVHEQLQHNSLFIQKECCQMSN